MFSLIATIVALIASLVIVLSGRVSYREKIALSREIAIDRKKVQIRQNARRTFVLIIVGAFLAALGSIATEVANLKSQKEKEIADSRIDSLQRRAILMTSDISGKTDSIRLLTERVYKMNELLEHKQDLQNEALKDFSKQSYLWTEKQRKTLGYVLQVSDNESLKKNKEDSLSMMRAYGDIDRIFRESINTINETTDTTIVRHMIFELTETILGKLSAQVANGYLYGHPDIRSMWDKYFKDYNTVIVMLTSDKKSDYTIKSISWSFDTDFQKFKRSFEDRMIRHLTP